MNPTLELITIGFLYIVIFGGLSLFRREGLSSQFAIEAIVITLLVAGLNQIMKIPISPILFLIILYLITMRVRILVDVGNSFSKQTQNNITENCYRFAEHLLPDHTNRLIIWVNRGALQIHLGLLDEAIDLFKEILQQSHRAHLGVKYEAASHYNLGVAYRRKDMLAQAITEFNAAIETWPVSIYAQHAEIALNQLRQKEKAKDI